MKVYHTSNYLFDFPSFEVSDAMIWKERSGKAFLGFYVGSSKKIVDDLGMDFIYELELDVDETNSVMLPLDTMVEMYNTIGKMEDPNSRWVRLREMYRNNGTKIMHIVEGDGRVGESAITDLSCIKSFKRIL